MYEKTCRNVVPKTRGTAIGLKDINKPHVAHCTQEDETLKLKKTDSFDRANISAQLKYLKKWSKLKTSEILLIAM